MRLDDKRVTPIPSDTRIRLRQRTPVGENYVELRPGRSRTTLADGGVLPLTQADDFVDVDQVLSVLQGDTRERARSLMQGLGGALRGHGDGLNALLAGTASALTHGSHVVRVLADDRRQVGRLVAQLGDLSGAIGQRERAIGQLSRQGTVTFRAIASRDGALRRLLAELPPTLAQARRTTTTLRTVTRRSTPVVANLAAAVADVRPAVRALTPAARVGRGVVAQLGIAAPRLEGTLGRLRSLAPPLSAALPGVRKALCQVDPMLSYARPYTPDVVSALVGLGSSANSYDALGHLIRMTPIVNDNYFVGGPTEVSAAAHELVHSGLFAKSNALTWYPYPKPGEMGRAAAHGTSVLGAEAFAKTGYKYPHVVADC
jgi:phospholipid/cholesterol/gamma-HCH transport system substrate-binding protein